MDIRTDVLIITRKQKRQWIVSVIQYCLVTGHERSTHHICCLLRDAAVCLLCTRMITCTHGYHAQERSVYLILPEQLLEKTSMRVLPLSGKIYVSVSVVYREVQRRHDNYKHIQRKQIFYLDIHSFVSFRSGCIHQRRKLRNKSWKPECVLSFNIGQRILVFYLERQRGKNLLISCQPMLKLRTHSGFHELFRF